MRFVTAAGRPRRQPDKKGLTWDTERLIVLRNDAAAYDLGYPIGTALPDDTILTIYYFATADDGVTHIACTRWGLPAGS